MRHYVRRSMVQTAEPVSEPLTLAETKLYLRVDGDAEDLLITSLIIAARRSAEHYLRRSLMTQGWKLTLEDFCVSTLPLSMGPVGSVEEVRITARDDTSIVMAPAGYWLGADGVLCFDEEQSGFRLEVSYEAGFGDAEDIPGPVKQAMLIHISRLYELRGEHEPEAGIPSAAVALYGFWREVGV